MNGNNKRNKKINKFKGLCNISQKDLKKKLVNILQASGYKVHNEDGFVFAQGELPVLLVAHMDTVHKRLPEIIFEKKEDNKTILSSPYGIGGDDRCGIFMILEIIKELRCSVLFTEDEEIGGIGANKFSKSKYVDELKVNYIMEFDRANAEDAVFYYCDNPDFTNFVTEEFYNEEYGSYSDIVDVAPALGVAAVNLSCGYYNAHTVEEYVVWEEMLTSINQAKKIIAQDVQKPFEYMEAERIWDDYWGSGWGNYWGSYGSLYNRYEETYQTFYIVYYENGNQTMSEAEATNKDAALLDFLMWHDSVPYKDIIEIFSESELNSY